MILNNCLYKITSTNTDERSFDLQLIRNCIIYQAHFPEQPVTPGVCIIQIASELLSELQQSDFDLTEVPNAKFLAVINPLETPEIKYTFKKIVPDEETESLKVSVLVSNSDTIFTKLSLVYRKR